MWKKLRQPLSAAQMAGAVAVVLLIGGAFYGVYAGAAALWHRHLLVRSIPRALAGIRKQREEVIAILETYKRQFGSYPPMFTRAGPDRGKINPLCYELLGVRFEPKRAEYYIPITKDALTVDEAQKYFNSPSFTNCLVYPKAPTNFLANRALAVAMMSNEADLYGLGLSYTDFTSEDFWSDYQFSPWRYATNPAEHNPGRFDLWVEVTVAGRHFTLGNWPQVQ
jgi:hypothetical protein